jgi:hypothetical protein
MQDLRKVLVVMGLAVLRLGLPILLLWLFCETIQRIQGAPSGE